MRWGFQAGQAAPDSGERPADVRRDRGKVVIGALRDRLPPQRAAVPVPLRAHPGRGRGDEHAGAIRRLTVQLHDRQTRESGFERDEHRGEAEQRPFDDCADAYEQYVVRRYA